MVLFQNEAMLFSHRPGGGVSEWATRPKDATRWLGMRLDSAHTLRENLCQCTDRARQAEARLCRLVNKPETMRPYSHATAEMEWRGAGVFQSTPLGIESAESMLTPGRESPEHLQAKSA